MKRHPELTTCHFCGEKASWLRRLLMWDLQFRQCPNCGRFHLFHKLHYAGFGVWRGVEGFQPRCDGRWLKDHGVNGHIAALEPGRCSRCGMLKGLWDKWFCTAALICGPEYQKRMIGFTNERNAEYLKHV